LLRLFDLSRQRAIAYGWTFLGAQLAALFVVAVRSHGLLGGVDSADSTDSMMLYASGRFANFETPALVYDLASQQLLQNQIFGEPMAGGNFFPFYYPLIYMLVCALLARLPYFVGLALWVGLTGAAFVATLSRVTRDWALAIALCSFPAVIVNGGLGQNAFLTASLLGAGMLLVDRRPWLAGLAFGAISFNPHFLILVPIALLAGGRWRTLAAMALTVTILTAASAVFFGLSTWRTFLENLPLIQAIYGGGLLGYWAQISLFGAVRLLGGYGLAWGIHGAAMAVAGGMTAYVWWKDFALPLRATALIAGTLVCVPINLVYDLALVAVAVAFLCRADSIPRLRPWEKAIIVAD